MLLPSLVSIIYGDHEGFYYIGVAAFLIIAGFIGCRFQPKHQTINVKEGYVATGLSWIIMSLFGCLPIYMSGEIDSFTDAVFEIVSGFTTTGASILHEVETLSHTALFWRSFTHWIGGMGVLVFLLALIPMSGGSNINLMKAESPGPSVGKLVPKMRYTAIILYLIYVVMTLVETILLLCGGLNLFDSLCLAFGTAGTGGFAVTNASASSNPASSTRYAFSAPTASALFRQVSFSAGPRDSMLTVPPFASMYRTANSCAYVSKALPCGSAFERSGWPGDCPARG